MEHMQSVGNISNSHHKEIIWLKINQMRQLNSLNNLSVQFFVSYIYISVCVCVCVCVCVLEIKMTGIERNATTPKKLKPWLI